MPKLTIVLPTSRPDRIDENVRIIKELVIPEEFEKPDILAVMDNTAIDRMQYEEKLKKLSGFGRVRTFQFDRAAEGEFNSFMRRNRITEVFAKAASMIQPDADFVFCLEDDTGIEPLDLMKLWADYKHLTEDGRAKVGLVSGVEAGRWQKIVGAWRVNDVNEPTEIQTIPFNRKQVLEEVDATGFYAFITPAALFRAHQYSWHDECFGPDVVYGLSLRQQGYRNVIDWTVEAIHYTRDKAIKCDEQCVVMKYEKKDDKWQLKEIVKPGV